MRAHARDGVDTTTTERSMSRAMCGVHDLIQMLNKAMDQFANAVHWHDHVLRRENGHVLRRALDLEVEGQREADEDMEEAG